MDISKVIGGAKAKAEKLLQDFNKALPIMKDLGLSVGNIAVNVSFFPSMQARLRGSIDCMKKERIQQLITQHQQNKIAVTVLKGLYTAANVQNVVKGIPFKGVEVQMKLGILSNVNVNFIRDGVTATASEVQRSQISDGSSDAKGQSRESTDSQDAA